MKLITLNIWGGKIYGPLIEFIKQHSATTDVFCFQDVLFGSEPAFTAVDHGRINIFNEIRDILSDFNYTIFRTPGESHFHSEIMDESIGCGQVIFTRKSLEILDSGGFRSPDGFFNGGDIANGKFHWVRFNHNGEDYTVLNIHGIWQRGSQKMDTPERLEQSQKINDFLATTPGKKIVCGDLNLAIDNQSVKMLEEGMVNLVRQYGATSTRSSHYSKEGKFADYIFTSEDIKVSNFQVLQDEVSDHLPLCVEFD